VNSDPVNPADPYQAVLLLSFGGPERPDEVLPFLQNVTRGRGIPAERLAAVAEHYHHLGGASPINDQNRALLAALRRELDGRGLAGTALYWGNRNWHPFLVDALRQAHDDGVRRLAVLVTSAYSSYSGCRQYREDLAAALAVLAEEGRELRVDKIRAYFNHPGFVAPLVDATRRALEEFPEDRRHAARVVFVAHSIPTVMNDTSGPDGGAYTAQLADLGATVATGVSGGEPPWVEWDLAYCSRSGPPGQPWLEPDINDHLRALHADDVPAAAIVPIGFVSDHLEVVYDLDTQARQTASDLGLPFVRVPTAGIDRRFVGGLVDLLLERAATERGESVERAVTGGLGPAPDRCPADCCRNPRGPAPVACGADGSTAAAR
jgi:ferrochelatase